MPALWFGIRDDGVAVGINVGENRGRQTTATTTTATTAFLEAEKRILAAIQHNQKITLKELADALGMTKDGVRYHTDNLKNKGRLRRIGTYN